MTQVSQTQCQHTHERPLLLSTFQRHTPKQRRRNTWHCYKLPCNSKMDWGRCGHCGRNPPPGKLVSSGRSVHHTFPGCLCPALHAPPRLVWPPAGNVAISMCCSVQFMASHLPPIPLCYLTLPQISQPKPPVLLAGPMHTEVSYKQRATTCHAGSAQWGGKWHMVQQCTAHRFNHQP